MAIWGKVLGGVGGFAFGGPLGAILGATAGHFYDKKSDAAEVGSFSQNDARQTAFTTAIIVLSAKMAKADGQVSRSEIDSFKSVFNISPEDMPAVGALFNQAKEDASGFEPYAEQIAEMFTGERQVLEDLVGALLHIAMADGHFHPEERKFLRKVTDIFGFSNQDFERLTSIHSGTEGPDPYEILGVESDISDADLKKAYREQIRLNHPDRLMSHGLPQEFIDLANEKMMAINAAYDQLEKSRGLK